MIGLGNDLLPVWCQAIHLICAYFSWTHRNKHQWNFSQSTKFILPENILTRDTFVLSADLLLQVNNNTLVNADHHRAVAVLKDAGNNVTMVVARESLLAGHERVVSTTHQYVDRTSYQNVRIMWYGYIV